MLSNVKIGDRVTATFMNANPGLQTIQRINGRRVFLHRQLDPRALVDEKMPVVRPGDTWLVEVLDENPHKTVYFVKPLGVVRKGDGKSSLLEKVLEPTLYVEGKQQARDATSQALMIAQHYCANDRELLELLTSVIEYFVFEWEKHVYRLSRTLLSSFIIDLVESSFGNDVEKSDYFIKLARLWGMKPGHKRTVLRMLRKAQEWGDHATAADLQRIINLYDSSVRILDSAVEQVSRTRVEMITPYGYSLHRMLGETYLRRRQFVLAKNWLELAVADGDYEVTAMLAQACFELGEFERAATLFHEAYGTAKTEILSASFEG